MGEKLAERFVIRRGGAFFRPNAEGYTNHVIAAGYYTRDEADKYRNVEGVTIVPLSHYQAEAERTIAAAFQLLEALSPGTTRAPADPRSALEAETIERNERRARIQEALLATLDDSLDCTRVWSAWGYGTMGQDDFVPVLERLDELVDEFDAIIFPAALAPTKGDAS